MVSPGFSFSCSIVLCTRTELSFDSKVHFERLIVMFTVNYINTNATGQVWNVIDIRTS